MLWPWPLTFDLEHLQCIACDTMKLCTKFERNRVICNRVIAISIFDLMTLNAVQRVALGSESLTFGNYSVYDANTLCHAVTLTFDPLILKVQGTSSVTWSKSVQNPNFVLFDPLGKLEDWWARSLYQLLKPYLRRNLQYTFDGHPLSRCWARWIDKNRKERKFLSKT